MRTVCVTPQVWRWSLQSRRWSAGCHPSLWGPRTDRRCVWPLQAELWCSPLPQDHREDQPARPIKHTRTVWLIRCKKRKKKHDSLSHSAVALVNMDEKGKTQRKRKCSPRGDSKHEMTLLLLFIWPVQRPASWQWPAWRWLEPPICEQRCPLCQITNLSLANTGLHAACILGSAPGPCQPENSQQIIQNDKIYHVSWED